MKRNSVFSGLETGGVTPLCKVVTEGLRLEATKTHPRELGRASIYLIASDFPYPYILKLSILLLLLFFFTQARQDDLQLSCLHL